MCITLVIKVAVIIISEQHLQDEAPSMPMDEFEIVQTEQHSNDDDSNLHGYHSSESELSGKWYIPSQRVLVFVCIIIVSD